MVEVVTDDFLQDALMKGIARTQKEIEFHDRVAALGCISCRQEGIFNPWVSIHHAHGRTKPGCHMWVLPLCEPHHQDNGTAIARHPYKRRWEAKYGNEDDLIRAMWTELGVEFTEPVRVAKPVDRNRPKNPTSVAVEIGAVKMRELKPKIKKTVRTKLSSKPLIGARNKNVDQEKTVNHKKIDSLNPRINSSSPSKSKLHDGHQNTTIKINRAKRTKEQIKANEEYKENIRKRRAAFKEMNKDKIEEKKARDREFRRSQREKMKSNSGTK